MSDCSTNAFKPPQGAPREPFDACELKACFYGEHKPWTYPLALNGRVIKGFYVGGIEYAPVRECEDASKTIGRWTCSECGRSVSVALTDEPPRFCCGCGRKVKR